MFVLYPESQQDIIDYAQSNFPCAWALHDKDVWTEKDKTDYEAKHDTPFPYQPGDLKKPHVHFICKFANARSFDSIAKELGVSVAAINRCNNIFRAYLYLTHKADLDKYQYPDDIVGMHEFEVPTPADDVDSAEEKQVAKLLDKIKQGDFKTIYEMALWALDNDCWSSFRRGYSIFKDINLEVNPPEKAIRWDGTFTNPDHPYFGKLATP